MWRSLDCPQTQLGHVSGARKKYFVRPAWLGSQDRTLLIHKYISHTDTHSYTHSHTRIHAFTPSFIHTHTHTNTLTCTHACLPSLAHIHSYTYTFPP